MLNFSGLVNYILEVEQGVPPTQNTQTDQNNPSNANALIQQLYNDPNFKFKELLEAFKFKFGITLGLNPLYNELNNTVPGGKYNIAAKYVNDTYIPIIDAFSLAVKQMTSDPKAEQKPTMEAILKTILQAPDIYNPIFLSVVDRIKEVKDGSRPVDYTPIHPVVNRAANTLRGETEKLAQTAIESLSNEPIFEAISKIIAKRISVLDRITAVKGLRRPFSQTLIKPILMSWKKYISLGSPGRDIKWEKALAPLYGHWQKKISGDFNQIIDDVTSDNLLLIAVYAGEYYISLLGKVVLQESKKLDKFDTLLEVTVGSTADYRSGYENVWPSKPNAQDIRNRVLKNVGQTRKGTESSKYKETNPDNKTEQVNQTPEGATPLSLAEYNDMVKGLGDGEIQDYKDFITRGTSRFLGKTVFNLGTISKDPSNEAKSLYNAIKGIAYHVPKNIGAKKTVQAIGALRVGMGPVN
jgi:hypothetical protein